MKKILWGLAALLCTAILTPKNSEAQYYIQNNSSGDSIRVEFFCLDSAGIQVVCDSVTIYVDRLVAGGARSAFLAATTTSSITHLGGGFYNLVLAGLVNPATAGTYVVRLRAMGSDEAADISTPFVYRVQVGPMTTGYANLNADPGSGTIAAADFAAGAIDANAIATDAIGAAEIAASAIGASEIATDAIGAAELASDAEAIALSVNGRKFNATFDGAANDNIDANVVAMATNSITAAAITDGAIGAAEIAADAIGSSELAATAADEIGDSVWGAVRAAPTISATTFGAALDSLQDIGVKVLSGGITSGSFAAGAITQTVVEPDYMQRSDTAVIRGNIVDQKIDVGLDGDVQEVNVIGALGIGATSFASDAITSAVLATSAAQEIATWTADSIWESLFDDRNDVANSWGQAATTNLNTLGWAQTGSSTGADSGVVARIVKRMIAGMALNGTDSLMVSQRTVTVGATVGAGAWLCSLLVVDSASGLPVQGVTVWVTTSGALTTDDLLTNSAGNVVFNLDNGTHAAHIFRVLIRLAANADTVINISGANFKDTISVVTLNLGVAASGLCRVYAYERDPADIGIPGLEVTARLTTTSVGGLLQYAGTDSAKWMNNIPRTTFTSSHADSLGLWYLDLLPPTTLTDTCAYYTITVKGRAGQQQITKTYRCVRPPGCAGQQWIVRETDPCPSCE